MECRVSLNKSRRLQVVNEIKILSCNPWWLRIKDWVAIRAVVSNIEGVVSVKFSLFLLNKYFHKLKRYGRL